MKSDISAYNPAHMNLSVDTFEIYHYRQPYFKTLDFHNHDYYEFYIFLDGVVTYYIEEKVYDLCAGDILVIPPGKMHRPVISDPNAVYERIVLSINADFIASMDDEQHTLKELLNYIEEKKHYLFPIPPSEFEFYSTLLERFIHLNMEEPNIMLTQKAYILLLLDHLRTQKNNNTATEEQDQFDTIPEIINYINENLSERLTLDDLSNRFFISKYHLIRKFKAYTNATVYDYIISKRIVLAKKLLREGVSATDTCLKCGFTNYSNFYKSFQDKAGMSPAEFKASLANNR